jgi:hypothetical protein
MEESKKCQRIVLAGNGPLRIESCDCGAIHLIVGFATMRLDRFAFGELAGVIAEAMGRLEAPPQVH